MPKVKVQISNEIQYPNEQNKSLAFSHLPLI